MLNDAFTRRLRREADSVTTRVLLSCTKTLKIVIIPRSDAKLSQIHSYEILCQKGAVFEALYTREVNFVQIKISSKWIEDNLTRRELAALIAHRVLEGLQQ